MEFYSVVLRKKITIPQNKIRTETRGGRKFYVGTYQANGKTYDAWMVAGKN